MQELRIIKAGHDYDVVTEEGLIYSLHFQDGVKSEGRNGLQNEEVIEVLLDRLRFLNTQFPCRENSLAITKLEEALMWLNKRTENRIKQGVEGKHEPHKS